MALFRGLAYLSLVFIDQGTLWQRCVATAAEAWGFLFASLWMIPRFHRGFTLTFSILYVGLYVAETIVFILGLSIHDSASHRWSHVAPSLFAVASGVIAAVHYYRKYTCEDTSIVASTNNA